MRPIRVTGVVGTSPPVPLDVYTNNGAAQVSLSGAGTLQVTIDDVYTVAAPSWVAPAAAAVNGIFSIPPGTRAVRATGMAAPDVLVVSQQGAA
jgi:hypothetical protein